MMGATVTMAKNKIAKPEATSKPFWEFKSNAANGTTGTDEATLYIYGDIVTYDYGDWNFPDDVVPNKFKDELNALVDVKKLHVRINSGGGSVFAAVAIMNLLKAHTAKIIVHVDGICASAASIVAMAGDTIYTALGAMWMIHNPTIHVWDNMTSEELKKEADTLDILAGNIIEIYRSKTTLEVDEIKKMMDAETWLTGQEALQLGFADASENIEVEASLSKDKVAYFNGVGVDTRKFKNTKQFAAMIGAGTIESKENGFKENAMNLEKLKSEYPEIYEAAKADGHGEGYENGVKDERCRIKEIYDMTMPGMGGVSEKAMFIEPVDGAKFAKDVIMSQKEKGWNYLNNAREDSKRLDGVSASTAPTDTGNDAVQRKTLLDTIVAAGKNLRQEA
jgi:ATP-dependent protease ClpP protease subunit